MKIKTYGGNKIGGCITEISSNNAKIIFDYGTNLDDTKQIDIELSLIHISEPTRR